MRKIPSLVTLGFAMSVWYSTVQAASVTVYAKGPYEVWGGGEIIPDIMVDLGGGTTITVPGYYDTPGSGYAFLGQSNATASFVGDYRYFVVGTTSLFTLDAVQIEANALQGPEVISSGNVHLPWQFDADGNLIGSVLDYAHTDNIFGLPDGLTDDVGIPLGYGTAPGGPFEGFVALTVVPLPASIWLFSAGLLVLLGRFRNLAAG